MSSRSGMPSSRLGRVLLFGLATSLMLLTARVWAAPSQSPIRQTIPTLTDTPEPTVAATDSPTPTDTPSSTPAYTPTLTPTLTVNPCASSSLMIIRPATSFTCMDRG
mgnify:CR=1 FL=1